MATKGGQTGSSQSDGSSRNWLALGVVIFGFASITILAVVAIINPSSNSNGMTILNMVLPVVATWIGTVLAFFFGRANFESANLQVQQLVDRVQQTPPGQRAQVNVTVIMRRIPDITSLVIPAGKSEHDFKLSDLYSQFSDTISRLPVIDADSKPKYMIHQSSIDSYLANEKNASKDDLLDAFIAKQKANGIEFGLKQGFVLVSEATTLADAKHAMEAVDGCLDIFVTKGGTQGEPLTGWISNQRLTRYMQA